MCFGDQTTLPKVEGLVWKPKNILFINTVENVNVIQGEKIFGEKRWGRKWGKQKKKP